MSIYFISKEMSEQNLGIILAITPITTILVNPFWNYIVKDMKVSRMILKIMTLIEGLLIIILTQVSGFELHALIVGLIAFFCSPFIYIQDGYTSTFTNLKKIEYSSIRIYASIAYVIASAIAGFIIQYVGYEIPFVISGIFFASTALIAFWIKPIEKSMVQQEKKQRDFKSLLKNKEFYKYLIFYTIVIGSVRIGDSFFGVFLLDQSQFTLSGYGLLYSAFVFVEVLTLRYLSTKGTLFKERNLIIFASLLFIIRFLTYALNLPIEVMIIFTMFRGLSWGTIIYTNIKYIIKIVKVENVTTAILIVTLAFSVYTGVGNFLSGTFIQNHGFYWLYLVNLILIAIGLLFFIVFTPKINNKDEFSALTDQQQ